MTGVSHRDGILGLFKMTPSTVIHGRRGRCHPSYSPRRVDRRNLRVLLPAASTSNSRIASHSNHATRKNPAA